MLYLLIGAILAIGAKSQCSSDGDCLQPGTEACETTSGVCVPCNTDADCEASSIYSLAGTTTCVSNACTISSTTCSSDSDCSITGYEACETSSGICVPCNDDSDCEASSIYSLSGYTTCSSNICTGSITTTCSSDDDCSISGYEACETTSGACVPCNTDADCEASSLYSLAGTTTCTSNLCIAGDITTTCSSDDDCSTTGYEACYTSLSTCVPCNDDSDCTASLLYSQAGFTSCLSNVCTIPPCSTDSDCTIAGLEICDTSSSTCVACKDDSDCETSSIYSASGYTTCDSNDICTISTAGCSSDSDCSIDGLEACETSSSTCVPCNDDSDCQASSTYSALGATTCVSNACTISTGSGCSADSDCSINGYEACETSSSICVPCNDDSDCAASSLYSSVGYTSCVSNVCTAGTASRCSSDSDCSIAGLEACETTLGTCVPCNDDSDCAASSTYSSLGATTCVSNACTYDLSGCSSDGDCTISGYEACDTSSSTCVPCNDASDCAASSLYSSVGFTSCISNVCTTDITSGCSSDSDCTIAGLEACETSSSTCVPCNTDADCEASSTYSSLGATTCISYSCTISTGSGCSADSDCSITGYEACETTSGTCVPCNDDNDCAASSTYSALGATTCISNVCTISFGDQCEDDGDCPDATPNCYTYGDYNFCYLGCSSDSDCTDLGTTYACLTDPDTKLSGCIYVECLDADDCSTGEKCLGNECLASACTTLGGECGDYICTSDGSCVICEETSDCTSSYDYGTGYICVSNACIVETVDTSDPTIDPTIDPTADPTTPAPVTSGCSDDDDCEDDESCIGDYCVANKCSDDEDCYLTICSKFGECVVCEEDDDCTSSPIYGSDYTCQTVAGVKVCSKDTFIGSVGQFTIYISMVIMALAFFNM